MTMSRPRHPLALGLGLASAAALLLAAACEMPRPTEITPAEDMPLASIRSGGAYTVTGHLTPAVVREAVAATLPSEDVAAARGTPITLYFVADAAGRVVHAEYQRQRTPAGTYRLEPSRSDAADAEREQVRVRMKTEASGGAASAGSEARATSLPGAVASIDPKAIGSIEILKAKAGDIVADDANVIWVTLKDGATLESARLSDEAMARRERESTERVRMRQVAPARPAPMPGSAAAGSVRLRSEGNTVTAAEAPLYVIDGVVVEPGKDDARVRDLDPETIESIEVLKGSAATAKYGDAGKQGVIVITLKKRAP